jgi:hypothetical protein
MCRARQAAASFPLDFPTRFPPCLPMICFLGPAFGVPARNKKAGPYRKGEGVTTLRATPAWTLR